ncbi:MAG: C-terminal binding protein [Nitrospiraceae bacterium]|nr:C-terminal binding protein [Nitrospiraceae bacterium]
MTAGEAMKRVVVIDTGYDLYDQEEAWLGEAGASLSVFEGGRHDREAKAAFCRGADGVFVRWTEIDGAFLDMAGGIKALVRYGVGYDNVDIGEATRRGIRVCNVQGYATHSVSDHALALILACLRGLRVGQSQLRSDYGAPPFDMMPELKDLTLGILGLGRIGGALCSKAQSLFQRVIACDPYIAAERFVTLHATPCDFDTLLRESDVLSVHCNLTDETRGCFSEAAFARMRPGGILINTARGPIMDEDALLAALNRDHLYGAGIDVWCDEPPLANRDALLSHPRLVGTGHYAWFSSPASRELQRRAAENMVAMLRGGVPEDCLNAEAFGG